MQGLVIQSGALKSFYGDGSDGSLSTSANVTYTSTLNGPAIIKQYTSLTINSGHTLTTSNPCQGLIIYVQNNLVISGSINMSSKAPYIRDGNLPNILLIKRNSSGTVIIDKYFKLLMDLQTLRGGAGGNGGSGASSDGSFSIAATGGTGRIFFGGFGAGGGGGSIGSLQNPYPPDAQSILHSEAGGGRALTPNLYFCNYSGAGSGNSISYRGTGAGGHTTTAAPTAICLATTGGACNGGGGGGGAGNYATTTGLSGSTGDYAGGFIMIICGGNVTINASGTIVASGGTGGAGGLTTTAAYGSGGGGGGSGGGVVSIYYKGTYSNAGSITVAGGAGGAGGTAPTYIGTSGSSGSVGTIHTQQIV